MIVRQKKKKEEVELLFFSVAHTWLVCLGRKKLHYLPLQDCAVRQLTNERP